MKSMELLTRMFVGIINRSTSKNEELSLIPSHRWEVYTHNSLKRQKQILSNIAYCRDLQNTLLLNKEEHKKHEEHLERL